MSRASRSSRLSRLVKGHPPVVKRPKTRGQWEQECAVRRANDEQWRLATAPVACDVRQQYQRGE